MTWQGVLQENQQRYVDEFIELLRIPSVSTADAHADDVLRAAQWVAERLNRARLEHIEVLPTGPHACVYGDWLHAPGKPTVLIYAHFDVQPADPLELWKSPPFDPVIKDGRIYARGAADTKGNLLLCLIAVEALLAANGSLPLNVKFLFEGQEEIGSRDLAVLVAANRERLACDLILSADSLQWGVDQPMVLLGLKGMCALQIDVETAAMDLHSGLYGGAVPNAVHALAVLIASFRDEQGRIQVDGFYESVVPLAVPDRDMIRDVPFDESSYKSRIGVDALVGEPGYSTYERAWARPTLEVNGIWGGYQGDGVKTVIPAQAHAKITCRLVANQDPDRVLSCIESHVTRHSPPGARVTVTRSASKARAYQMPADHPSVAVAADVLEESYGRPPYFVRMGGSLPITDLFLHALKAYTVSVGFALDDEAIHSPNEFMRLVDFERGQVVYARLLERLGEMEPRSLAVAISLA